MSIAAASFNPDVRFDFKVGKLLHIAVVNIVFLYICAIILLSPLVEENMNKYTKPKVITEKLQFGVFGSYGRGDGFGGDGNKKRHRWIFGWGRH